MIELQTSVAETIVEWWKKAYARKPKTTIGVTVSAAVVIGALGYIDSAGRRSELARQQAITGTYSKQLQQLQQAQSAMRELSVFLDGQRQELAAKEQAIQELRAEQEKLQPLVDADRRAVDALFAAQEERNQRAQSSERWFGFATGVVTSLLASILWYIATRFLIDRKKRARES